MLVLYSSGFPQETLLMLRNSVVDSRLANGASRV